MEKSLYYHVSPFISRYREFAIQTWKTLGDLKLRRCIPQVTATYDNQVFWVHFTAGTAQNHKTINNTSYMLTTLLVANCCFNPCSIASYSMHNSKVL